MKVVKLLILKIVELGWIGRLNLIGQDKLGGTSLRTRRLKTRRNPFSLDVLDECSDCHVPFFRSIHVGEMSGIPNNLRL